MSTWLPPVAPAHEAPEPPPPPPQQRDPGLKRWLGPLALIGFGILKFGAKLKALLLLLPKLKVLTTSASMLVSVAAYAVIWGWKFAVGFVALLFVHEMGHVVQMKREGVQISGMLFIPFLGAAVGARSMGGNALAEARIGLAGPVLGTLGTAALIPLAEAQGSDFLRALAFTGFFLNLFNLAPVVPLDGGRAMAAMAPWMWFAGFAVMLGFFVLFPEPDPRADPAARRDGDLAALEDAQAGHGGQRGLLPRQAGPPAPRRGRLRGADRGLRDRDGPDVRRSQRRHLTGR